MIHICESEYVNIHICESENVNIHICESENVNIKRHERVMMELESLQTCAADWPVKLTTFQTECTPLQYCYRMNFVMCSS